MQAAAAAAAVGGGTTYYTLTFETNGGDSIQAIRAARGKKRLTFPPIPRCATAMTSAAGMPTRI